MEKAIRFKTRKEFIKEFGKEYGDVIKFGWNSKMNDLFGKPVPDEYYDEFVQLAVGFINVINLERRIHTWSISRDMITTI